MNRIFAAALEVQAWLQAQSWHFCFIGSVAVQRWGQPRNTQDIDLTLLTGFGEERKFIERLLGHFKARRVDAADFALQNRVLLLEAANGVSADIALGALPFEANCVQRASPFFLDCGASLLTCCAEDLVVHKCFASRDRDWSDVETILIRQMGKLNFPLIWSELNPLIKLKEEPEIADRLRRLISRVESHQ